MHGVPRGLWDAACQTIIGTLNDDASHQRNGDMIVVKPTQILPAIDIALNLMSLTPVGW